MRYLRSFHLKDKHTREIEKEIYKSIYSTVFYPVLSLIASKIPIRNSYDVLTEAIMTGELIYSNGKFYGEWNAKISKAMHDIGAKFNYKDSSYTIDNIPYDLQLAIANADTVHRDIIQGIGGIDFQLNPIPKTAYDKTAVQLRKEFILSLLGLILIIPRDIATDKYIKDLNKSISEYTQSEIDKLLTFVNGNDNDLIKIYKYIGQRIEMSKRKSKNLAFMVTNMMINEYKMQEYRTYGITHYKWKTMGDDKVRPFHRLLDGKIIDYNFPPIQDEYGNTAHAGCFYNCRCRQIPILNNDNNMKG